MKWGGKYRWLILLAVALITAAAGLLFGKAQENTYLKGFYHRSDFTLLDDKGEFFQLSKFPSTRLLLLVFTPDVIHPSLVRPFQDFSAKIVNLQKIGVDVMMITRTNREIARNFKEAAHFESRMLVDVSGTVGRNIGVWPDINPVNYWSYALMDHKMQVFWADTADQPMSYEKIIAELQQVSRGEKPKN